MPTLLEIESLKSSSPEQRDKSRLSQHGQLLRLTRSLIMENEHSYRVTAWWASGRTGLVKSDSAPNAIHFTTPPQFGGMEGRWSPEDLLLSAVASCFTSTFHALAERSRFHFTDLEVEVRGCVSKSESGYMFSEIVIRPTVKISADEDRPRAERLMEKAKRLCLVSRALAVKQKFEPLVQSGTSPVETTDPAPAR
jgi:peroxiredoxin-like protein